MAPVCAAHGKPQRCSPTQTLPDIVRDLEHNCGAEAILPPALYQRTETAANANTDQDDDGDDNDEDDAEDAGKQDSVVKVAEFQPPPEGVSFMNAKNLDLWMKAHQLVKNPFATLLQEENEIKRPFRLTRDDSEGKDGHIEDDSKEDLEIVCVLNVNFAGNESHESVLRVRIQASLDSFGAVEQNVRRQCIENSCSRTSKGISWIQAHAHLVDCLVHYGYVLWNEI